MLLKHTMFLAGAPLLFQLLLPLLLAAVELAQPLETTPKPSLTFIANPTTPNGNLTFGNINCFSYTTSLYPLSRAKCANLLDKQLPREPFYNAARSWNHGATYTFNDGKCQISFDSDGSEEDCLVSVQWLKLNVDYIFQICDSKERTTKGEGGFGGWAKDIHIKDWKLMVFAESTALDVA